MDERLRELEDLLASNIWNNQAQNQQPPLLLQSQEAQNQQPPLLLQSQEAQNQQPPLLLEGQEAQNQQPPLLLQGHEAQNQQPPLLLQGQRQLRQFNLQLQPTNQVTVQTPWVPRGQTQLSQINLQGQPTNQFTGQPNTTQLISQQQPWVPQGQSQLSQINLQGQPTNQFTGQPNTTQSISQQPPWVTQRQTHPSQFYLQGQPTNQATVQQNATQRGEQPPPTRRRRTAGEGKSRKRRANEIGEREIREAFGTSLMAAANTLNTTVSTLCKRAKSLGIYTWEGHNNSKERIMYPVETSIPSILVFVDLKGEEGGPIATTRIQVPQRFSYDELKRLFQTNFEMTNSITNFYWNDGDEMITCSSDGEWDAALMLLGRKNQDTLEGYINLNGL